LNSVAAQYFSIFFPLFFAAMWLAVSTVLGVMSGWFWLMSRFPDQPEKPILRLRYQSGTMGAGVRMSAILSVAVCPNGLRLSMVRLFGPFCRSLFIPWDEITVSRRASGLWPTAKLQFGSPAQGSLRLSGYLANRLARTAAQRWPEVGPFPEPTSWDIFLRVLVEWILITSFAALFYTVAPMLLAPQGKGPPVAVAILFPAIVFGLVSIVTFLRRNTAWRS
jgi:hypothetical protein